MSVTDLLRAAHAALSPVMTPATAPGGNDGIDVRAEVVRTALYEVLEGRRPRPRREGASGTVRLVRSRVGMQRRYGLDLAFGAASGS
jgi:hypothetical protein